MGVEALVGIVDTGLTESEVESQQQQEGYNELSSGKSRSLLAIAGDTVRDPIFILLLGGGVIYWILGDLQEAMILLGFVVFIAGISLYQEGKTERALEALRDLSSPRAFSHLSPKILKSPNPTLWWTIGGGLVFLGFVLYVPFLRQLFSFSFLHSFAERLPWRIDLVICVAGGAICLLWFELLKLFDRHRRVK
jgi:Cation transporter/ATPase, N-terminus